MKRKAKSKTNNKYFKYVVCCSCDKEILRVYNGNNNQRCVDCINLRIYQNKIDLKKSKLSEASA